jgi:hypothetical protein
MAKPVPKKNRTQKKGEKKKPVKLVKPKIIPVKTKKQDVKTVAKSKALKPTKKLQKVETALQKKKPVKKKTKKQTKHKHDSI